MPRFPLHLLCLTLLLASAPAHSAIITLSDAAMSDALQQAMPVRHYGAGQRIELDTPRISLNPERQQISAHFNLKIERPGQPATRGAVIYLLRLGYQGPTGQLFATLGEVLALTYPGGDEAGDVRLRQALEQLAQLQLAAVPLRSVSAEELNHSLLLSALKSVQVQAHEVLVDIGFE